MRQGLSPRLRLLLAILALSGAAPPAHAEDAPHEPVYEVKSGDTIAKIARRHSVTEEAIRELNELSRKDKIKPGQKLTLPAPDEPAAKEKPRAEGTPMRAVAGHRKGVVHLVRGHEKLELKVLDRREHLSAKVLSPFAQALRYPDGQSHKIDPRLITLVAIVSEHFGGRDLLIVSGYRPYSPTQYTRESRHNIGRALDFTIRSVSNEKLRDFCRTLRNVGVGYYPNSTFIHLDVRNQSAYWVDYAGPGQKPRYDRGESTDEADEGAGEVPLDVLQQANLGAATEDKDVSGSSATPIGDATGVRTQNGKHAPGDSTGEKSVFPGQK
jgi:uncharacterized protein YcbK (DUF882 family)